MQHYLLWRPILLSGGSWIFLKGQANVQNGCGNLLCRTFLAENCMKIKKTKRRGPRYPLGCDKAIALTYIRFFYHIWNIHIIATQQETDKVIFSMMCVCLSVKRDSNPALLCSDLFNLDLTLQDPTPSPNMFKLGLDSRLWVFSKYCWFF